MLSFLEKSIIFDKTISDIIDNIHLSEESIVGETTGSSDTAINMNSQTRLNNHKAKTDPSELQKEKNIANKLNIRQQEANTAEKNREAKDDANKIKQQDIEMRRPGGQDKMSQSTPTTSSLVR